MLRHRFTRHLRLAFLSLAAASLSPVALAQPERAPSDARLHHQDHPTGSPILASYDFEQATPSGPDTFWARQQRGAEVALSRAFKVSGERSLHITEVAGNRDFAEFLAYFPERREGEVYVQFYLLLTDADQHFNFGLAGERWFLSSERHGHAIWLQTADGSFRHQPHSGWQTLFAPRLFVWYFVDIVYHVDAGTYDLALWEEGLAEPRIDLHRQLGLNGHPSSAVRYFSLIGDLEDQGHFDFFVDDLLIASDPAVRQSPFVAPGRRRFFVEMLATAPRPKLDPIERRDLFWQARRWLDELETREPGQSAPERLVALEAAADEAFLAGELDLAERAFTRLRREPENELRMMLKLSDIEHLAGNVAGERALREAIYGRLEVED